MLRRRWQPLIPCWPLVVLKMRRRFGARFQSVTGAWVYVGTRRLAIAQVLATTRTAELRASTCAAEKLACTIADAEAH